MQHTRTAPCPPVHAYRTYMAIVSPHIHTRVHARALTIGGLRRRTVLDWVGLWSFQRFALQNNVLHRATPCVSPARQKHMKKAGTENVPTLTQITLDN